MKQAIDLREIGCYVIFLQLVGRYEMADPMKGTNIQ
jgi:hypothetical protein